jgi:hypothetical protein
MTNDRVDHPLKRMNFAGETPPAPVSEEAFSD